MTIPQEKRKENATLWVLSPFLLSHQKKFRCLLPPHCSISATEDFFSVNFLGFLLLLFSLTVFFTNCYFVQWSNHHGRKRRGWFLSLTFLLPTSLSISYRGVEREGDTGVLLHRWSCLQCGAGGNVMVPSKKVWT